MSKIANKFFFGHLPSHKRLEVHKRVTEVKIKDEFIEFPNALATKQLTINFSAAAIESFELIGANLLSNEVYAKY